MGRARREPSRLGGGSLSLWDDLREVLLNPDPDPRELEVIRRWLRDEVERDLYSRLNRGNAMNLVRWACRVAPRLIWRLPYSRAQPPERFYRRIVAILLPLKLRQIEREIAVYAFHQGLSSDLI